MSGMIESSKGPADAARRALWPPVKRNRWRVRSFGELVSRFGWRGTPAELSGRGC